MLDMVTLKVEARNVDSVWKCRIVGPDAEYPTTPIAVISPIGYAVTFHVAFPDFEEKADVIGMLANVASFRKTIDKALGVALSEFIANDFQVIEA